MEEKKQIKVSLGAVISIFIIFLTVALVGICCYYNFAVIHKYEVEKTTSLENNYEGANELKEENETTTEDKVKIEGEYHVVGNDNSEGLTYTFEGNTVTFNAIYITKGTYEIVGNKIKITYSEAYEDGKAIEFPNGQYEELTIVDENTLTSQKTVNGVVYNGKYVKKSNETTENKVKIEGEYHIVGNDNSEGLTYTFEGNTVTFNAIYITKGTYEIVGNKIQITYSEAYEDGKAIEFPNGQYEELTIVDENTLTSQKTVNGVVYNGKYVKDSKSVSENPVEETKNTEKDTVNVKLGEYELNEVDDSDDTGPDIKGCGVTLKENNECYIYEGYGSSRLGVYYVQDNKVICNTVIAKGEEGGLAYYETNMIFTFEVMDNDTLKLIDIENNDKGNLSDGGFYEFGFSKGKTYSIK